MPKSYVVVLILVILVSIVASTSIGYIIGNSQSPSFQSAVVALNQTRTVTTTIENDTAPASLPGSFPISPNPFEFSVYYEGKSTLWYLPVVFLGAGTSAEMYVNYECSGVCGTGNSSIDSQGLSAPLPKSFAITVSGKVVSTSEILFSSATVVQLQKTSETLEYTLFIAPTSAGFYTFTLPYDCVPSPVLYVKTSTTDYAPLIAWLRSFNSAEIGCSDSYDMTILGFTNSYYTEIALTENST